MVGFSRLDRSSLESLADWTAVAVAVDLPWSTSAVGIAIVVWRVNLLPSLNAGSVKRALATPAAGFAVVLWCLGVIGMLWADVSWHDRLAGLNSFHRLLAIPLLLAQFRRSGTGILKESLTMVASAPIIGHGTGSIPEQFGRITAGKTGASADRR